MVTTMVSLIREVAILAELLGKNPETWSNYDKAMLQRVPLHDSYSEDILEVASLTPFGGEVDALPTPPSHSWC